MACPALPVPARRRVFHLLLVLLAVPGPLPAAEVPAPEQDLAQVEQAIARIEDWLEQAERNRPRLEQRLAETEERLAEISLAVTLTRQAIATHSRQLEALHAQQQNLLGEKQAQVSQVRRLLQAAYREGADGAIKLVLNQQDPTQAVRMLHYYRLLNAQRVARLRAFEQTLADLAGAEQALLNTEQQLDQEQNRLDAQLVLLDTERQARRQALEELDAAIAQRGSARADLLAERETLQALIEEVRAAVEDLPRPDSRQPFAERKGRLSWPGEGPLLTRFGEPYGNGELERQGLTIGREPGAAVRAVHAGRVVFADWLRGYGLLIILDHGEGYLSLYGQNQSLAFARGAWVETGSVIATAGDSGGQRESGTYFEIRYHGLPQDPTEWLETLN